MLTFRRALIVAVVALSLFFLFFSGNGNMSPKDLLRDESLERQLLRTKEDTEQALREFQRSADRNAEEYRQQLRILEEERRLLDKQLEQLRRLPADAPLRTQLAFQFPYSVSTKFPALIWQTWKQDYDDPAFDERFRDTTQSWRQKNEGFVHEVLSDKTAQALIRHLYMNVPRVIEAYEAMPHNILRADFFRYLILLARGGTYSDVDTRALKPVPNWIPENVDPASVGLIVGIEADPDRPDWNDWYARRIQFCQWTINSKPGHPVLRDIVANITEHTLEKKASGTLALPDNRNRGSSIMDWTGPGVWTDSLFGYFNDPVKSGLYQAVRWDAFSGLTEPKLVSDVLVLPITSFSPGIQTMGAMDIDDPMAFVQHEFEGSWKPEDERHIGEN